MAPRPRSSAVTLLILGVVLGAPARSLADADADAPRGTDFAVPRFHLMIDLPMTVAAAAGWLALDLAAPGLTRTSCPCSAASLNALDRPAASWHWAPGGTLADVTLATALVASAAALVATDAPGELVNDLGLTIEATVVTGLLTEGAKIVVGRPYPFMYGPTTPSQQAAGENYNSFWSGHTAVAMAATLSAAGFLQRRGAPLWLRVTVWSVGPLLALTAGSLMASAGNHFPTDIAAGALAGSATSLADLALHRF